MSLGMAGKALAQSEIIFNTVSSMVNISFADKDGNAISSYGTGGAYVATFWYSGTSASSVELIGVADIMTNSKIDWYSYPDDPIDLVGTATGFLEVRIFQLSESFAVMNDFDTWLGKQNETTILSLYNSRAEGSQYGVWATTFQLGTGGTAGNGFEHFIYSTDPLNVEFSKDGTVKLNGITDAIPEPSTWLLLGAGAAFIVILRRKKKDA